MKRTTLCGLAAALFAATTAAAAPSCTGKAVRADASPYLNVAADFRPVIEASEKLQHPVSSGPCLTEEELAAGFTLSASDTVFGIVDGRLRFDFRDGSGNLQNRMELRGLTFDAQSSDMTWFGGFTLPDRTGSDGFTIGQIFGVKKDVYSKPIVRFAVIDRKRGFDGLVQTNHLWAVYRDNTGSGSDVNFTYYPLGPAPSNGRMGTIRSIYRPDGRQVISVRYQYGKTVRGYTIPLADAWLTEDAGVYHKAGCYLQDDGDCRVDFHALSFSAGPKPQDVAEPDAKPKARPAQPDLQRPTDRPVFDSEPQRHSR